MNIVLIGYRCSGKTSSGKTVAKKMKRDFKDIDVIVEERAGRRIEEMVAAKGWAYFRSLEKDVIREVSEEDNLVIATGGGVVTDGENVRNLKRNGFVIWLKADVDTLRERMKKEHESGVVRPSLTGKDPVEEVKAVLELRNPLYEAAGDLVIETDDISAGEIAESIIREASVRLHRPREQIKAESSKLKT
jgi:shikimate kinase